LSSFTIGLAFFPTYYAFFTFIVSGIPNELKSKVVGYLAFYSGGIV